jgi:hypothetical protein
MKKNILIFGLALTTLMGCGVNNNPGAGEKIGQIVKVSKTGIFNETYECELVRGGFQNGGGVNGGSFHFTIPKGNNELVDLASKLMESQKEVLVYYRIRGIYGMTSSDNGIFAISIKEKKTNSINLK